MRRRRERVFVFARTLIGDIACTTPALRALRQRFLQAHIVGINPGASSPERQPERYAQVADALQREGMRIALLGGAGDLPLAKMIRDSMETEPSPFGASEVKSV